MSGIYLKGLKTPEKNPITVFIYPSGKCYCLANNIKDIDTFRLLKTEAVQVPDHGRLIDADALGERMHSYYGYSERLCGEVDDFIISATTIIPADKDGTENV